MKLSLALASTLLIPVAVAAHASSSTHEAKPTPTASQVTSDLPAPRPAEITLVSAPVSMPEAPGLPAAPIPVQPPIPTEGRETLPELASPFAWTAPVVSLREIPVSKARDSRHAEVHGVIPRAARSTNPGVAGALLGFCNLFNPFAPQSMGVETSGENWYDGSVRSNPLPWGLRDERFHEAQTPEFSTELGRLLSLGFGRTETRPALTVQPGVLLTLAP